MRLAAPTVLLLLVLSATVGASPPASEASEPRIVNGVLTWDPAAVGSLLCTVGLAACYPPDTGNPPIPSPPLSLCSGTLIGCETFLTAAHCVCNRLTGAECNDDFPRDPSRYRVFLQHAGSLEVAAIVVHPDFHIAGLLNDVAVLKLAAPVFGIPPVPPNDLGTPAFGSSGTLVGFGRTQEGLSDYGLKRTGQVVTANCMSDGAPNAGHVCWSFEEPVGPPGDDSSICGGDSGGPLLVDLGAGPVIAGLANRTTHGCAAPTLGVDQDVSAVSDFIALVAGPDLGRTCGAFPAVGEGDTITHELSGVLSAAKESDNHQFAVDPGATMLRVALNAFEGDGLADFDLYVRAGAPATPTENDCAVAEPGQFGGCEIPAPAPGIWHVLVTQVAGEGEYQVTAVAVPEPAHALLLATGGLLLLLARRAKGKRPRA